MLEIETAVVVLDPWACQAWVYPQSSQAAARGGNSLKDEQEPAGSQSPTASCHVRHV